MNYVGLLWDKEAWILMKHDICRRNSDDIFQRVNVDIQKKK